MSVSEVSNVAVVAPAARSAREPANVRSVERCIDILEAVASAPSPLSLSEISRAIDCPKSTALTILRTLAARGLLQVSAETKQYRLGLGFGRFLAASPGPVRIIEVATPFLEALARETLETATLAELEGDKVFNTCRFVGQQPLQLMVPIGIPRELHATAGGKVFLAWMGKEARARLLGRAPLRRFTDRTITDSVALERHLRECRRAGFAVARGETSPDLFGIAAPIFWDSERVAAAVNLSGPRVRLADNLARYSAAVCRAAEAISKELAKFGEGPIRR